MSVPSLSVGKEAGLDIARRAGRVGLACGIGTAIERYDFFIYGTAAALVFAPQFFPQVSDLAARLAAFLTFAVGFVALPLGGMVMGHVGDRRGRKSMLVLSLTLMGASTFAVGVLPNYSQIGIWAPLLLVVLRFGQGFALGGEWGSAVLMSVEHAPNRKRGLYGSFVALGLPVGVILANLVFLVTSAAFTRSQFLSWAWRIPFVSSAVLVGIGLWVRRGIPESPVFAEFRLHRAERRRPIFDVLRNHWRTILLAAGSYLSSSALGFIAVVYFVSYATARLGLSLTTTLTLLVCSAVLFAGSIVVFATLSDRWGRRWVMTCGLAALAVWSLIFFPLIDTKSVPLIGLALCGMMILQGPYIGSQPAVFAELFPATIRYSGVSLSVTIGSILGGALAPLIATALFGLARSSYAVTAYLVALSFISCVCGLNLGETYKQPIAHEA